MDRPSIMQRLFQRIEQEAGLRCARGPPAHDPAGIGVEDDGDVDEDGPSRDISEVEEPQDVPLLKGWSLRQTRGGLTRQRRGAPTDRRHRSSRHSAQQY